MGRWLFNYATNATPVLVALCCAWLAVLQPTPVSSAENLLNAQSDFTQTADFTLMGKKGGGFKGRGKASGKPRMKRPGMRSAATFKNRNQTARSKYSGKKKTAPKFARSKIGKTGGKSLAKKRSKPPKSVGNSFSKKRTNGGQKRKSNRTDQSKKVPPYLNRKVSKKNKSNRASNRGAVISSKWGRNRLVKELHKQGFVLDRPTRNGTGKLYRHPKSGAEVRIMKRPQQRFRKDPPAKHQSGHYYRKRSGPDKAWGAHTSIPDK